MKKKLYYVYKHVRLDTNTTFYVGKGIGRRARAKEYRNQHWYNIVNKHGYRIEFIKENLSEDEANLLEHKMILLYQRYNRAETNLNLDFGIGGRLGRSDEDYKNSGLKISATLKGKRSGSNNGNFGNTLSDEQRRNVSEGRKGKGLGLKQSVEHIRKRLSSRYNKIFNNSEEETI